MLRFVLRAGLFAVVAVLVYSVLVVLRVVIAGEVSCYEVCSPTTEFFDRTAPWPMILGIAVAVEVAYLVARPCPRQG